MEKDSFHLINWFTLLLVHRNKTVMERGEESWSSEPEKDAEFSSGSRSQLHEQGFQQSNSFLDIRRDLVPSDLLPFLSNWLILLT